LQGNRFLYYAILNHLIENFKSVIDRDKENYFAWVLTGAAAQELGSKEQAIAAYQKAIQYNSAQAPAWQVNHRF
jgi:Tfp pilus assembly protein PilF